MAFVAVLPTAGTILGGLGAAASGIPIIGSVAAPLLGGLGGAAGAFGGLSSGVGLGSVLGNAATSLGSGILGSGAGLLSGADKLVGGFLPNVVGGMITPQQGFLGHGDKALLGGAGLGLLGGPGQFLGGPAVAGAIPAGVAGAVGGGVPVAGGVPGAVPVGGAQAGGIEGFLGNVKEKVDPVLGPITKVGVGAGKAIDVYNKITGNDGSPAPGTNQTPAQAAQNPQYNPYVPTTKAQPIAVPVNVGAASGGGPTSMAVPTQQVGGVPVAAYVPMEVEKTEEDKEEEIEELKNMLAMQGNFLSGVVNRTA